MLMPIKPLYFIILFVTFLLIPHFASSTESLEPLSGLKKILLVDKQGVTHKIGTIAFTQGKTGTDYKLKMDHTHFVDYFLSMKEMKCLEGPELWCHLSYPYQQPHQLSRNSLVWLEHDLLFMFKRKGDFGANFWNGIYYRLKIVDGRITGEAQAVDLNILASPPENLKVPPIGEADLDEIDWDKRWLPKIEIRE